MIETPLPSQVELLCLTHRAPLLLQGTLDIVDQDPKRWRFTSKNLIPMNVQGHRAIINFNDASSPMLTLKIDEHQDSELVLASTQLHKREKRLFPRLFGLINLSCKETPSLQETEDWLQGTVTPDQDWLVPNPLMNFSINGASFISPVAFPKNSKLLIQLRFDQDYRGIGRVVRCSTEQENYEVAVYFEDIPEKATQHLMQLTLDIQDSLF